MNSYGKNIASNFVTHIITMILGFITSVIVARSFGPEGRGQIAYLFLIFGLISDYGHFGINNATTYFQKRSDYGAKEVYSVNLSFLIVVFLIMSLITITLKSIGVLFKEYAFILIVLALVYVLCNFTVVCHNSIFIGDERIKETNFFTLINKLTSSFLIILLWIFHCLSITSYVAIVVCSLGINAFLLIKKVGISYKFNINCPLLVKEFKYGIIVYLSNLFGFLNYRVDQFMIKNMIDAKNLGVYAIGVTLAELVFLVPSSVVSALAGRLFNIDDKSIEKKTITCKTIKYTFYICLLIVLIGTSFLRFIPLIYGKEYSGAAEVTLILFIGIIFASIAKVSYSYFLAGGRPFVHLSFTFSSFIVNIVFNFLFIPAYGINGAAFASTISYTLYGLLYIIYFVAKEKFRLKDLIKIDREDISTFMGVIRK